MLVAGVAAKESRRFRRINAALLKVDPDKLEKTLEKLRRDPRVRYAEPNFLVHADALPNDPSYGQLWGLHTIGAASAWNRSTGSSSVVAAVIDTGVDQSHPDLAANTWVNPGEDCSGCRTDGADNDGNGYVDDWRGWDFVNDDNNPLDDHGHGTHVAGTIGAVGNNATGVVGVNWRVQLMALKFLSAAGSGTTADAVSAVLYATANGASVLNNSWSGDEFSQALADAIDAADERNSLFVAAAGNGGATPTRSRPTRRRTTRRTCSPSPPAMPATAGVLQQLRPQVGRPRRTGGRHPLDVEGRLVRLLERNVDGGAARCRCRCARAARCIRAPATSASRRSSCAQATRRRRSPD